MPALLEPPPPARPPSPRWTARVAAAAVLAFALAVFAHGCHGDEDHELFAKLVQSFRR